MLCDHLTTSPPHQKLKHIHSKASPLIIPKDRYADWLNPENTDVSEFSNLLLPNLPHDLSAQKIDKPSSYQPIGHVEKIAADI